MDKLINSVKYHELEEMIFGHNSKIQEFQKHIDYSTKQLNVAKMSTDESKKDSIRLHSLNIEIATWKLRIATKELEDYKIELEYIEL